MVLRDDTMTKKLSATVGLVLIAAGCTDVGSSGLNGTLAVVPEQVLAIAAPYQDLNAVRFGPDDNCYWYRHAGPVETTWLPLRTVNGNPICTKPEGA